MKKQVIQDEVYVNVHKYENNIIVTLCDKDLIKKTFTEGDLQLNITERFYKGEEKTEEEIIEILKEAVNLNIVGEKSIKFALDNNRVNEKNIIKIDNIPHAQVYLL